jgi:hypothetical protein
MSNRKHEQSRFWYPRHVGWQSFARTRLELRVGGVRGRETRAQQANSLFCALVLQGPGQNRLDLGI